MEFTIMWFWIAHLLSGLTVLTIGLKVYQHKLKSKMYNILLGIVMLLYILTPIKIDGSDSKSYSIKQIYNVSNSKVLPEMVETKDFRELSTKGITNKDLE